MADKGAPQSPLEDADIEVSIDDKTLDDNAEELPSPDTIRPIKAIYDDFSLTSGSASGVRFRNHNKTREFKIYDHSNAQLILEEVEGCDAVDGDDKEAGGRGIRIRQSYDTSYGLQFLRATYSLVAVFVGGFLLIMGISMLLFLFIDLATQLGVTSNQELNSSAFIAVGLSIPVFVYSLAIVMTLMTRFVVDTFYGHPFLRTLGLDVVTTDWIAFVMYLGIPILTILFTLYQQRLDWWEVSCLTWFASVLSFYCVFSLCCLWFEAKECLDLIVDLEDVLDEDDSWFKKTKFAIVRCMGNRLGGTVVSHHKLTFSNDEDDDGDVETTLGGKKYNFTEGVLTKLTKSKLMSCIYKPVDPPKRFYTLDETRGSVSFVTRTSWSLEKLFCQKGGLLGSVPVTAGDYGITRNQINSTIICRLLGLLLYVLILGGLAHWFGLEGAELGILIFVLIVIVILANCQTYRILYLRRDIIDEKKVFRYFTKHLVTSPNKPFTLGFIVLEIVLFFIIPLAYIASGSDTATAMIFLFFGCMASLRHYLNAQTLLSEIGPEYFDEQHNQSDSIEWKKKHRFYQIAEIGADRARWFWVNVFIGIIVFFVFVVLMAAYDTATGNVNDENYGFSEDAYTLMSDFSYDAVPDLPYPTCSLKKGITSSQFDESGLTSYAFLAGLAYAYESQTQQYLDEWFGENQVTNDIDIVNSFKMTQSLSGEKFSDSAVSYRFFSFGDDRQGVLSIRGTSTIWDLMADAQLWLPATLFQVLRFFLPAGNVFTPILHRLTTYITILESSAIGKVAFYKETASFVKYLKEQGYYVIVTGHSLGGGLALITGSQTDTIAIGMSAPNTMISRESFSPSISEEALNTLTFNVIPTKDIIPMVDDKARIYQNINCTAPSSNFVDCHSIVRTLCEIQYSCSSQGRPVPCECVLDYGYPEPNYIGNGTASNFTQECLIQWNGESEELI